MMYKVIMRLATINSVAINEAARANITNLPQYAASVNGDVDLINTYFDVNMSQLLARGQTVHDLIAKLFDTYLATLDHTFRQYISKKQDDYHDGNLGHQFTYESLMTQVTAKFTPKDGEPTTKDVGGKTYQWCVHHMAWGIHSAQDCRLGASCKDVTKTRKGEQAQGSGPILRRRRSHRCWRHEDGKQCTQLQTLLGSGPLCQDHPVRRRDKYADILHVAINDRLSRLRPHLPSPGSSFLFEGACAPNPRPPLA